MMSEITRRAIAFGLLFLMSGAAFVFAQTAQNPAPARPGVAEEVDPNSREFDQFVDALTEVEKIQNQVNNEIDDILSGFSGGQEKFMELHQHMQASGNTPPSDATDSSIEEYETAIRKIDDIQMSSQQEMIELVEEIGLSVNRFNEMVVAVQQDSELQSAIAERRN